MSIKSIPWIAWVVVAAIAFAAVGRHPYSYYTMTRFIVSIASTCMILSAIKENSPTQIWSIGFVGLAVLFNPIAPFYLIRSTWQNLDLAAGAFFIFHLGVVRLDLGGIAWKKLRPIRRWSGAEIR